MKKILAIPFLFTVLFSSAQEIPNTLTPAQRVYGLSRFWQEVNYNFVYLYKIDRQVWDSTYQALIPQVEQTKNDYEYYRLLQKFCAMLKDGHTNVWPSNETGSKIYTKMFGRYWFGTENVAGKAIVNMVLKSELNEIPIGTEIIEVNGLPTSQYLKDSVEPYIASSTDYVRKQSGIENLLQGIEGASYNVKFKKPDGGIFSLQLTHARTADTAYYPTFVQKPLLELKWYKNDIAYLALNSFDDEKIDSLFKSRLPELYKAKALIIDLRNNGGGSTGIGTYILQYLVRDSTMKYASTSSRIHIPVYKAWGKYVEAKDTANNEFNKRNWLAYHDMLYQEPSHNTDTFHLTAKRLVMPTAILIGNNTASAAEDFLISADGQKHMIKIGERSFGSTGQPYLFDLPGGGSARVCTKKDTYPDGREFVGVGVIPDIEVAPTVQDFIDNKDPVLDKALSYLNDKLNSK